MISIPIFFQAVEHYRLAAVEGHTKALYNLAIAFGAVIEVAIGGNGRDTIFGNAAVNTLNGNSGNDTLSGGLGHDWLAGAAAGSS